MRPQHITAENGRAADAGRPAGHASMRPQHITAENSRPESVPVRKSTRFNEAAAYHCGKLIDATFGVTFIKRMLQ